MTAPRDANGDFLPPQYRFTSVRAGDLKPGDTVSWPRDGRSVVCEVRLANLMTNGRMAVMVTHPDFRIGEVSVLDFDTTVNRVEAAQ